ncbi:MAG: hypothetical protein MMC33_003911 [Icmadophila ericetorum]|nr:hypothetical protein [Icmadophila ericetorum]
MQPLTKIVPDTQFTGSQSIAMKSNHSHSRTVSSSIFPFPQNTSPSSSYQQTVSMNRRTPSNATTSSSNTLSNTLVPVRTSSSVSLTLRRSTSSRSGVSITTSSYVASMRKQKATVWCDRAQHEDPSIVAQQKRAKQRATMEVIGGNIQGRSSLSGSMGSGSLGVRSKIRHHGAPKAVGYTSQNLVGGGVPMRLSASEVGEDDYDDTDSHSQRDLYNQRNNSGRSSLASNNRLTPYNPRSSGRFSTGSTPPSGQGSSPAENSSDPNDTPVPADFRTHQRRPSDKADYFQLAAGGSAGSSGSSERESSFGNVGDMKAPPVALNLPKEGESGKKSDDLMRRGSVDERASTMRGAVRLFVANPDLDN